MNGSELKSALSGREVKLNGVGTREISLLHFWYQQASKWVSLKLIELPQKKSTGSEKPKLSTLFP